MSEGITTTSKNQEIEESAEKAISRKIEEHSVPLKSSVPDYFPLPSLGIKK